MQEYRQDYRREEQFCDTIEQILADAGLSFNRNHQVSSGRVEVDDTSFMYDRTGNLYADFFIQGTEKAIIECKLKPSPNAFYSGIGQCLVYKHYTNAKHLVLCNFSFWFSLSHSGGSTSLALA
jgi:hypothetical protein